MNLMILLPGFLAGIGLTLLITALLPQRPQLAAAIDRINATEQVTETSSPLTSREDRIGRWLSRNLPDRSYLKAPKTDLRLIGMSEEKYYYTKALLALVGLLSPFALTLIFQAFGWVPPLWVTGTLGVFLAVWFWTLVDQDVKTKAADARLEFSRAVAVYLELVASERRGGSITASALETAVDVGQSWVFARISQELERARYAGEPPWEALNNLSVEIGVPELADVAKISSLSEGGASIYESLRARGRTLRQKLLSDEHEKANAASERMQAPLAMALLVYVFIIVTPVLMRLLE